MIAFAFVMLVVFSRRRDQEGSKSEEHCARFIFGTRVCGQLMALMAECKLASGSRIPDEVVEQAIEKSTKKLAGKKTKSYLLCSKLALEVPSILEPILEGGSRTRHDIPAYKCISTHMYTPHIHHIQSTTTY